MSGVMLRAVTRVPDSCQSPGTLLCSAGAGRVLCVGSGPGERDAMESSKQERALPLLAAPPALGLDAGDKRP